MKDGVPKFTEINLRLGGGIPLAIAAGVDVPALLLARLAGHSVEVIGAGAYQTGLFMTRFDDSIMITEQTRDALEHRRL
jgi:carbamoyl-phosphate synthase large subunit